MNIYKKELLDHFNNPRNSGTLENPDICSGEYNPSCGDSIEIHAKIKEKKICEISFLGKGCVISQATASVFMEFCLNKHLNELSALESVDIISLIGINLGPTRMKCALLSLFALKNGIEQYKSK